MVDASKVKSMLDRVEKGLPKTEVDAAWACAFYLHQKLQTDYLRGGGHGKTDKRLARRSGKTAAAVKPFLERRGTEIRAGAGAKGREGWLLDVHEKGKVIRAKTKKYLWFPYWPTAAGTAVKHTGLAKSSMKAAKWARVEQVTLPARGGFARVQREQEKPVARLYERKIVEFTKKAQRG